MERTGSRPDQAPGAECSVKHFAFHATRTGAGLQTGVFSRYDAHGQIIGVLGWQEGPNMSSTHLGDEEQAIYNAAQSAFLT
ncbi:hypothetical protein ACFW5D_36810 [Streptomyces sp. NPDC058770]|uniref:hypothetical protein n=1 Tax=unclassified Streptomyces TaxID=2593676 RepID=UPI0036BAF427